MATQLVIGMRELEQAIEQLEQVKATGHQLKTLGGILRTLQSAQTRIGNAYANTRLLKGE